MKDNGNTLRLAIRIIVGGAIAMIGLLGMALILKETSFMPIVSVLAVLLWVVGVIFIIKYFFMLFRDWFKE